MVLTPSRYGYDKRILCYAQQFAQRCSRILEMLQDLCTQNDIKGTAFKGHLGDIALNIPDASAHFLCDPEGLLCELQPCDVHVVQGSVKHPGNKAFAAAGIQNSNRSRSYVFLTAFHSGFHIVQDPVIQS